jgi:hypothetical protein
MSKECPRCQGANHKKTISLFHIGDPANYALAFHWERSDKRVMGAMGRLLLIVLTFASFVGFDSAFAQSWVMTSAPGHELGEHRHVSGWQQTGRCGRRALRW